MSDVGDFHVTALVLAAGQGSRMGRAKQLLPWKDTTLLENAVKVAKAVANDHYVIIGAHANEIRNIIPTDRTIFNPLWKHGMGSSIACGVGFVEKQRTTDAVLIMLADQPLLKPEHYRKMVHLARPYGNVIYCTSYGGRAGVPAIFSTKYFRQLKALNGDVGARTFLNRYKDEIRMIDPLGSLLDVDSPRDYDLALSRLEGEGGSGASNS